MRVRFFGAAGFGDDIFSKADNTGLRGGVYGVDLSIEGRAIAIGLGDAPIRRAMRYNAQIVKG